MRDIAIIGAGIGGLTLALALHKKGFSPRVYERASQLGEVGAGLTLWPNAIKALRSIDLEDEVERIGEEPIHQMIRNGETGEIMRTFERKSMMRDTYGAPLLQIHRRDLHDMLVKALEERAPGSVVLGAELASVEPHAERPVAVFADGTRVEADLIVGCDGIRSRVRTALFGEEQPRFTQIVAWRGLVPMEDAPATWLDRSGCSASWAMARSWVRLRWRSSLRPCRSTKVCGGCWASSLTARKRSAAIFRRKRSALARLLSSDEKRARRRVCRPAEVLVRSSTKPPGRRPGQAGDMDHDGNVTVDRREWPDRPARAEEHGQGGRSRTRLHP